MAQRLLLAFAVLVVAMLVAVTTRVIAARPETVWGLVLLPVAALLVGPRTRITIALAIVELLAIVPLHAYVTLLRAARLEGG